MLAFFKAIPAFIQTWRYVIIATAVVSAAGIIWNYIDNHGEMKAQLAAGQNTIDEQILDIRALRAEIAKRDERLEAQRQLQLLELEQARERLQEAEELVAQLRTESAQIREDFDVIRFNTLEAIRDDEEMADWVDDDVPVDAWRLLSVAADGGPDS